MASVAINNLKKSFGKVEVLNGIDLDIADGEFVSFLGPSGCGKTTLLRSIAGLEAINSGDIGIGGQVISNLPPAKRNIAMVFQNYALYPHMNVYKNLSFGLSLNGVPKSEIKQRVENAAKILQITELLSRRPRQLSGGQKQRVAIGRAIVRDPMLFLLDEPLSNLDAGLRVTMRVELSDLHRRLGVTMIYVTHDQVEAMTLSNRVVVLDGGKVAQFGSPLELFYAPENLFVAGFIGSPKMNFVPAHAISKNKNTLTVTGQEFDGQIDVKLRSSIQGAYQDQVTLGIRPGDVEIVDKKESHATGTVSLVERLGTESQVHIKLKSGRLITAIVRGTLPASAGQDIFVKFPSLHCHVFDPQGKAFERYLDNETQSLIGYQKDADVGSITTGVKQ